MNIAKIKQRIFKTFLTISLGAIFAIGSTAGSLPASILSPIGDKNVVATKEHRYEVFGFAPYWTINKLDNVDFNTLTTLAYFGVPVNSDGSFDEGNIAYTTLEGQRAKDLFERAHNHGTRVVLTLTQMKNNIILSFLDDEAAQEKAITNAINLVRKHNMDGVNIDYEYLGSPSGEYKEKFSNFVANMSSRFHSEMPDSKISVSVYASAARDSKLYDIAKISQSADSVFMMAYDFATTSSDTVIPTAPLYGHKEGKYWYDISTAVDDFLKVMPAEKLILGLPWYGYNYPVVEPGVKVAKYGGYYYTYYYRGRRYRGFQSIPSNAQTYTAALAKGDEMTGWDDAGKVGWRAYKEGGVWRMIFLDDVRSLKVKYQFAKSKNLGGVGMWALGFDTGTTEMWDLLQAEFGERLALR